MLGGMYAKSTSLTSLSIRPGSEPPLWATARRTLWVLAIISAAGTPWPVASPTTSPNGRLRGLGSRRSLLPPRGRDDNRLPHRSLQARARISAGGSVGSGERPAAPVRYAPSLGPPLAAWPWRP